MKKLISWVEIPSKNFDRAIKFYKTVLKIELLEYNQANEKMACFKNGEGAIIHSPSFMPFKDGIFVSFAVPDSIEKTLARVITKKGSIIENKTSIQRKSGGYFAIILDSEGNRIGLFSEN